MSYSPELLASLEDLRLAQDSYEPLGVNQADFARKIMIAVVGATTMGKNTVMEEVERLDERFGIVPTLLTRSPAVRDNPRLSHYYSLEDAIQQIHQGNVAQYVIFPGTQDIYGTHADDFVKEFCMKDILAGAVQGFRKLGFLRTITCSIVSEPAAWIERFEERWPLGQDKRQARQNESIKSLESSIALAGSDNHYWIENKIGDPAYAARTLIAIATGTDYPAFDGTKYAERCIELARGMAG